MKKILVTILFVTLLVPLVVHAHSGRTNAEGCHNNRKTGDYHCHNSNSSKIAKTQARQNARATARDYNCSDFSTREEAQTLFERAGGRTTH